MSCFPDAIVCQTCGKALNLLFEWKDEHGAAVDLSDAQISIVGAYPPALSSMAIVPVDLSVGTFRVRSTIEQANQMHVRPMSETLGSKGPRNFFRVQVVFGPDDNDVTQRIVVEVQ